jgi:hypothetical protein
MSLPALGLPSPGTVEGFAIASLIRARRGGGYEEMVTRQDRHRYDTD